MSDDSTPPDSGTPPTPPPPPPAYGAPAPPPPPPYGAPAPAGASGAYSPVEAIQYGWAKFSKSPSSLLVPGLVLIVALVVIEVIIEVILRATILGTHSCTVSGFGVSVQAQCGPGFFVRLLGAAITAGVGTFLSQALFAGLIKSSLEIADGREALDIGEVISWATKPAVITTAAFLGAISAVGTLLFYLPGIIVGFLLSFTMYFVVDKGLAGIEAIKASFEFVTSKLGDTIVFALLGAVVIIVGFIACLIGSLVAIPVVIIAAAYTYRRLHDEPVSPVA